MKSDERWLGTTCLREKPAKVEAEIGVIHGCKICSEGEAKGHDVFLDKEFIDTVAAQGGAAKRGIKARFGHPNMCSDSLGTFVGRFVNFSTGTTIRKDGSSAACCFADLHLSESAKEAPGGDLYTYIVSMAENEGDMFGTSIVFSRGPTYRRDKDTGKKAYRHVRESFYEVEVSYVWEDGNKLSGEEKDNLTDELFIECKNLIACDCVDDPAANDGLFSAFSGEIVAGQITQFFDLHPHVFEILEQSPEIVEAVAQHGKRFDQFLTRYRDYRATTNTQEQSMDLQKLKKEHPELVVSLTAEIVAGLQQAALAAGNPALVAEITESATKLGAQAERDRIADVRAQALPGHESLIAQLELDGKSTGADAAKAIIAAENTRLQQAGQQFQQEANPIVPAAGGDEQSKSTIKRAEFDRLPDAQRRAQLAAGVQIIE